MTTRQQTQYAYRDGRLMRSEGESKSLCPFGEAELCLKHWWLAGWNDKDMEASK